MKKKIFVLFVIFVLCFSFCCTAFAAAAEDEGISPRGSLTATMSLNKVSGTTNTYKLMGTITATGEEYLRVYVYLYDEDGNFVSSASKVATFHTVTASRNVQLSPGRYKVKVQGFGDTTDITTSRYYTIP